MSRGFQQILVPVYPSLNADLAVQRAVEIADDNRAQIKIVHILNPLLEWKNRITKINPAIGEERQKWERKYTNYKNIIFATDLYKGDTIPGAIAEKAMSENADMIVLTTGNGHWFFPYPNYAARLASSTGIPVFSARKNKSNTTSIVIPVQQNIQHELLEKIVVLNKRSAVNVHLVSYKEPAKKDEEAVKKLDDDVASLAVLKAYQWLKSYIKCPVEHSVVSGANKTKAVNNYLHQIRNDVLLLQ